jgi:hypothetical protein
VTDEKKDKRETVFWSVGDLDPLRHETVDEAVADFLDIYADKSWPPTLKVTGWARVQPSLREGSALEGILEHLDEKYGDPDGGWTDPTPKMIEAERAFHAAVLDEYETWQCEPVTTVEVNVTEWLAKHAGT